MRSFKRRWTEEVDQIELWIVSCEIELE